MTELIETLLVWLGKTFELFYSAILTEAQMRLGGETDYPFNI